MPQTATVPINQNVTFTLDGSSWANNTAVAWGTTPAGSYTKTFNIINSGNTNITVMYIVTPPVSWTLSYTGNNTLVQAHTTLTGTLTLTVPSDALAGDYAWTATVQIT
jgi:uncharacterized membrane protein